MKLAERLHQAFGQTRRVRVLAEHFCPLLPHSARVLDVGCGDGALDRALLERRDDLRVRGIEVIRREDAEAEVELDGELEVELFDGRTLPCEDDSYDVVLFADVLHHTDDARRLLCEAQRVARRAILVKDHTLKGPFARATLRFMDDVGNARHGVALPHRYWTEVQWRDTCHELGLAIESWQSRLGLYPQPLDWLFGRSLHFVARFDTRRGASR